MTSRTERQSDTFDEGGQGRGSSRGRVPFVATAVVCGLVYLGVGFVMGNPWVGAGGLVVMLVYAATMLVAARRSETADLLSSSGQDERHERIQLKAAASTGYVVILASLAVFITGQLLGQDQVAVTAAGLAGLGGITYGAATAWYARRG